MRETATPPQMLFAPIDFQGGLVVTGYYAGEHVRVRNPWGTADFDGVIVGPANTPYSGMVWNGSQWGTEFRREPQLRIAAGGNPETVRLAPLSWITRIETDIARDLELAAPALAVAS